MQTYDKIKSLYKIALDDQQKTSSSEKLNDLVDLYYNTTLNANLVAKTTSKIQPSWSNFSQVSKNINLQSIAKCHSKIIILIKFKTSHFSLRNTVRNTWISDFKTYGLEDIFSYYFLLSQDVEHPENMISVEWEMEKYQDILLFDLKESYFNVTLKMLAGMNFVLENCKNVKYVYHIDDDTYFSPFKFKKFLMPEMEPILGDAPSKDNATLETKLDSPWDSVSNSIQCSMWHLNAHPMRPGKSIDWSKSVMQWNSPDYPDFCSGNCYGMPSLLYEKIYRLTNRINITEMLNLDDVLLTGIMRAQNRIHLKNYGDGYLCWHLDNSQDEEGISVRAWLQKVEKV